MRFHVRGVDHLCVCGSSVSSKLPEQVFPDATPRPAHKAIIDRCRRSILGRAIAPATAAFQNMHGAADDAAVVRPLDAPYIRRQMRFDPYPLLVAQPKQVPAHNPDPLPTTNQDRIVRAKKLMSSDPSTIVASLYNRRLLIDEQLLVALRGHPVGADRNGNRSQSARTSGGAADTGHSARASGSLAWRDFSRIGSVRRSTRLYHAAEGAYLMWLLRRAAEEPIDAAQVDRRERWKIRCFGRLRIYRNDGSQVKWDAPGGATRKTKTLFAYLLQKGGKGRGN